MTARDFGLATNACLRIRLRFDRLTTRARSRPAASSCRRTAARDLPLPLLALMHILSALAALAAQLDLPRPPGLVEERLLRPVETQEDIPALARNRLSPIVLLAGRRLRAEIDVDRTVGIDLEPLGLAADARELLVRLDHRARLVVVDDDRPEILGRNVLRQMQ